MIDRIADFPEKFFNKVDRKTARLKRQLETQTEHYLQQIRAEELKLKNKLSKISKAGSYQSFDSNDQKYETLFRQLKNDSSTLFANISGEYMPYSDSLHASMSFLSQHKELLNVSDEAKSELDHSLGQIRNLQAKMQDADQLNQFLRDRQEKIKQCLNQYTNLPHGITDEYKSFQKKVYYYSEELRSYKQTLNDPEKMEQQVLFLLNKLPAFREFMSKNSQLAGLFGIAGNYGSPDGVVGLQTTDMIQSMLRTQVASGGAAGQNALMENLQQAQNEMNQFRNKLQSLGSGSGDINMPEFRPNNQKTKRFLQRLEYGTNIQSTKSSYFWPSTTDIALSVAYKLDDKNSMGFGVSYKLGWGKDIHHIDFSSQGIGLRSFIDIGIKENFYGSGGFEYNYQKPFADPRVLRDLDAWQKSGLIGITKTVTLKSTVFKKTKAQILWDFLSYYQRPRTEPLKFRIGYNF
ncbi:MAG: hypothetical protein QM802_20690 [Agriterribacter sp.]